MRINFTELTNVEDDARKDPIGYVGKSINLQYGNKVYFRRGNIQPEFLFFDLFDSIGIRQDCRKVCLIPAVPVLSIPEPNLSDPLKTSGGSTPNTETDSVYERSKKAFIF